MKKTLVVILCLLNGSAYASCLLNEITGYEIPDSEHTRDNCGDPGNCYKGTSSNCTVGLFNSCSNRAAAVDGDCVCKWKNNSVSYGCYVNSTSADDDDDSIPNINDPDHPLYDPFDPQSDYDGDGIPNIEDNDPYDEWIYNPCDTQDAENYDYSKCADADFDFDGIPHRCDPEDGVDISGFEPDGSCPNVADLAGMDFDGDGIPNYEDPDSATDYPWAYDEVTYGPNGDSDGDGIPNKNDPDSEVYDPDDPYSDADGDGIPNNEDVEESTEDQCPEGQVAASFGSNAYAAAASSSGSGSKITCVPVACSDTDMDGVCDHCDPFPNNPNYYTRYILAAAWLRGGKYCAYGYFEGTCVAGSSSSCKLWVKLNPNYEQYVKYASDGSVASITGCTFKTLGNNPLNPQKCSQTCDSCSTAEDTIDWAAPMTETPDSSQTDSDGDGIMDNADKDQTGGPDTDGDGIDDNFDTFVDADNDGIDDRITTDNPTPGGTDTDGDGVNDEYQTTVNTGSDDVTAGSLSGIADAINNLAEALGLESSEDPDSGDTFSPITNSSFQEGYDQSGETLDFGSRFNSFLGTVKASALFGFSVSFFESVPSGGSSVFEVDGGNTFGRHTVDLDETMGQGLLALKGFMYVIFGFLSIRAIIMKR